MLTGAKCGSCSVHRNTQGQGKICAVCMAFAAAGANDARAVVQVADGWHKLFQNPLVLCGWREVREAKMVIMVSEQIAVYPERCFVSFPGP